MCVLISMCRCLYYVVLDACVCGGVLMHMSMRANPHVHNCSVDSVQVDV